MEKLQRISSAFAAGGARAPRRLLVRLSDESGIALVMALGIMLVLTIGLTTTILLTSSSQRHAHRTNAGQKAYALAETGVNNAIAVLHASYDAPASPVWPGLASYLPPGQAAYQGGSCTAPVNNCATWSGTIDGPLSAPPWKWQWRISATGTVQNPTGPTAAPMTRTVTAVVPIVIPPTLPPSAAGPLNFLYSGSDMWFENSVHVKAPVYVTGDLHLESTSKIDGAAHKAAIGGNLWLKNPQNQVGLTGGGDPRIDEIHVKLQCSSKSDPTLHPCGTTPGPATDKWDNDAIFATGHDSLFPTGPPFISFIPKLTCCAPFGGTIPPSGPPAGPPDDPSNMGFWYQMADLGPLAPCTTWTGTPPKFDTASGGADNSINWSASPTTVINLTPNTSYTCTSMAGSTTLGELSWDNTAKLLKVKGTIFFDGSITIDLGPGTARYTGEGTIVTSGTFGMKNSTICATHPGYTGACDFTGTSPWDPTKSALIVVADGLNGAGAAQGQGSDFDPGDGMHLKSAGFQGALIANHSITTDTTTKMQGPMISVYDKVLAGQSNDLIFPPLLFAPSGGAIILGDPPKPMLLDPQNFAGG